MGEKSVELSDEEIACFTVGGELMHCQICLHEVPGHEAGCPVLTGEPQFGLASQQPGTQGQGMEQAYQLGQGVGLTGSSWFIAQAARLKDLCRRAADALESTDSKWEGDFSALIAELREAACTGNSGDCARSARQKAGRSMGEKSVELSDEEIACLLRLIRGHVEYFRLLSGSEKCSPNNKAQHQLFENLALKLSR